MIEGIARLEIAGADPAAYAVLLGDSLNAGGVQVAAGDRTRLVFAVPDVDAARSRLERRGLQVTDAGEVLVEGLAFGLAAGTPAQQGSVELDHVVVHTADGTRAVADYAGRLGLDLRLERHAPQWGARMLFLRCGRSVLEVIEPLGERAHTGDDAIWGAAWRVRDVDATARQLADAGIEISEVRDGRKPGSRVLTVKDRRFGVPTLVIQQPGQKGY